MLSQLFRDSNEVMQHIYATTSYILQRISSNDTTSYNNSTDRPGQSGVTCQERKIPSCRAASAAGHLVLSWDRSDRTVPHGPVVCPGRAIVWRMSNGTIIVTATANYYDGLFAHVVASWRFLVAFGYSCRPFQTTPLLHTRPHRANISDLMHRQLDMLPI